MGVPKFYRWVSERYPCLSETVKEFQIPEFDNLYLDMNGIIHVCSHPEDDNPHFRITEEKIFKDIFHYLEFLFRIIKPRKVFFMAIDGVAPRAKMNQQRGRRFRSAREAELLEKKARESGETLPTEKRFDSNCITPGTEFMVKLHEQLKYFVTSKISSDPLWHGVNVYLSGHETPGEGEHKVMDFIRCQKSKPGYDPNTRHCLYGLDADLMMLGLATHEPHFSLLREEVRFGGKKDKNKRPATPEETTFHLLHLSLFREYLDFEFAALKGKLPFGYDLEKIIDDWILMGFLVGNDFIPHLPHLHIQHDALPTLWKTYMTILPECGGYMNEGGHLNLERFEKFMNELAKYDVDKFSEVFTDLKWFEGKKTEKSEQQEDQTRKNKKESTNQFLLLESLDNEAEETGPSQPSTSQERSRTNEDEEELDEDEDSDTFDEEFRLHKRNYYMTKLEYENVDKEVLRDQSEQYVRGIQWILLYYFEGVPSWSWFYPHHYAPYISDVTDFKDLKIEFEMAKPFLPFQQLMAVLPAASKELLPEPYQKLMTNENSPIIDFYPVDFQTDLNGKQQEWEAVVLIPFIDEKRLIDAMKSVEHELTPAEKRRNTHGPCLLYNFTPDVLEPYPSSLPEAFPDIINNHARLTKLGIDAFRVDPEEMVKGLMPDVRLDVFFPGFPTLKHIPHKAFLKKEGVKVFQMNSRNENMILEILEDPDRPKDLEAVANTLLGNTTFVSWPHLFEAKVVQVSDDTERYILVESPQKGGKSPRTREIVREAQNNTESSLWHREVASIKERYHDRLGVLVGETSILLKVLPMNGRTYVCGSHGVITLKKQFAQNPVPFVYQATVKDISVHDPSFCQFRTLSEMFPLGEVAFMLGWPHYGCQGEVLDVEEGESPRVRINVTTLEEPNLAKFINTERYNDQYYTSFQSAQWVGTSSHFLSRITGSIFIKRGSREDPDDSKMVNIGLNLKFTKKNEEVPGYTKLTNEGWLYSQKATDTVLAYLQKFPDMWDTLVNLDREKKDVLYEAEIFKNLSETIDTVLDYVKAQPCSQIKPQKVGADVLDEGVIKAIEKEVKIVNERNKQKINVKKVKMQVKPYLLYKPLVIQGGVLPDPTVHYEIFDRVVNIRTGYSVPFGLRGTVVGIQKGEKDSDTMYDVIFDEEFPGGIVIRGSTERGYRLQSAGMINITYGARKNGAAKELKSKTNQQNTRLSQDSNYNSSLYQQKQQPYHQGNQNRMYNSYADASRGGQGSYSDLMNRNEKRGYNDYGYEDGWGYNDYGRGQKGSNRQGNFGGRGYSGDYQANIDYSGYSDGQYYSDQGRVGFNGGRGGRNQAGNRDIRQQQKEENRRENQIKSQQSKSQSKESPVNSDMYLRQQSFDGSDSTKPTFVTPKVAQQARKEGSARKSLPEGQSEFANMWKQLQSSNKPSSDKKTETAPPSLDQAAAALDKVPSPQRPEGETDKKPQNLTLEKLFIQAKCAQESQESVEKEKSPKSTEMGVEETAAALKQMLKIGTDPGSTDVNSPTKSDKSYGRQLSVQELFDGAKQLPPTTQLAPGQTGSGQSVPAGETQRQKSQKENQQQNQRNQAPHPHQGIRRNPVMDLAAWCRSFGKPDPKYDCAGQPGAYNCIVSLPDGARFQGSLMKSQQEAIENAAAITLLQINQLNHMMGYPGMRPLASPNSAFKPVPQMLQSQNRNMVPGMRLPRQYGPPHQRYYGPPQHGNFRQQSANYHTHYNQNQQGPRKPQSANQGARHGDRLSNLTEVKSDLDPHSNPFVPLQVTRQQKTPNKRKESSDSVRETSERTVAEKLVVKEEPSSATSDTKDSNQTVIKSEAKSTSKEAQNTKKQEKTPQKSQGGQQKRRPRMAANLNFGTS
ncbi:5'-3' exoribonuclease 1-like [Saccostrea echinata]|uniref:5'-3' exoribonuclease 1-like n=1 Tax=Saccostrea echinata TaxID=191078 RepID=UPI002A7F94A5|nr:5'-3' exoribonuclease 1-like [Saccostrea echinata]